MMSVQQVGRVLRVWKPYYYYWTICGISYAKLWYVLQESQEHFVAAILSLTILNILCIRSYVCALATS